MNSTNRQYLVFAIVGSVTLIYCIVELIFASILNSVTLLSDGFHNFSDVASVLVAFYALKAQQNEKDEKMTYGWARAEVLGGLVNGSFLIAVVLCVTLEAIPKFIDPDTDDLDGMSFIIIAATGLAINTFGTVVFALTGTHGHSHGGGGHNHSHSHGEKEKKSHDHDHDEEHSHESEGVPLLGDSKKHKKYEHGHDHGHSHSHDHEEGHGHGHGHSHEKKHKESSGHGHSHASHDDDKHHDDGHGHSHKKKKSRWNLNVYALLIHYFGDMLSSFLVLIAGLLMYFFPHAEWAKYIDPASSIIIMVLIIWTTIPLLVRCSRILMQQVPSDIEVGKLQQELSRVPGVIGIHDLHVWPLVDDTVIASVHITCSDHYDFKLIAEKYKHIFHQHGIHSTSVQPEFVREELINSNDTEVCKQNCVENCDENWCCKPTPKDQLRKRNSSEPAV